MMHPLNEHDIWKDSDAEAARLAMTLASAPEERVLVCIPVCHGARKFADGAATTRTMPDRHVDDRGRNAEDGDLDPGSHAGAPCSEHAAVEDGSVPVGRGRIEPLERGELIASLNDLVCAWHCPVSNVGRFL
jgi:hypothetical protein